MHAHLSTGRPAGRGIALLAVATLAACASGDLGPDGVYDPLQPTNRAIHSVNKGLDTVILGPAGEIYGAITPDPVEDMVANATANLGSPGDAVNFFLQGDVQGLLNAVGRFAINSTIGLAGLFDPATELGIIARTTDFGQTLHVWGVGEGAYVEMPVLGPSTARDAVGTLVDFVLDPVNAIVPASESDVLLGARVLERVDQRHRFDTLVDQLLYESADSYTAAQIAYLKARRAALKGETDEADVEDPFAFE